MGCISQMLLEDKLFFILILKLIFRCELSFNYGLHHFFPISFIFLLVSYIFCLYFTLLYRVNFQCILMFVAQCHASATSINNFTSKCQSLLPTTEIVVSWFLCFCLCCLFFHSSCSVFHAFISGCHCTPLLCL